MRMSVDRSSRETYAFAAALCVYLLVAGPLHRHSAGHLVDLTVDQ